MEAERNLRDEGHLLGSKPEELKCAAYLRRLVWCIGPMGFTKGIYQYGRPLPCDVEKINMSTCFKAKLSQPSDKQRWIDDAIERTRAIREEEFNGAPKVLKRRKNPPIDFHEYQTITDLEEQMKILEEVMSTNTSAFSQASEMNTETKKSTS